MATVGRVVVLLWVDILAMYAMYVMMAYLTNVWKLDFTHAAAIVNVFWGVVTVLPLLLAFIVDTIMGNYWMLLVSSIAYSAGLGFLTMSTPPVLAHTMGTCSEYKPECIGQGQKVLFYTALPLIAFGMSGHLTSWNSFMAEQFSGEEDDLDENTFWRFFFSVLAVIITTFVAVLAIPYIKPWSLRFGIPAICTLVATLLFFSGSCSFKYFRPTGSPLTMFVRVFVAAVSKLFYRTPRDAKELFEIQNSELYLVPHTRSLRSLPFLSLQFTHMALPTFFLFLVDALLGNFMMLVLSSIAYSVGIGFVTMSTPPVLANSTGTCKQYESQCIGHTQKVLFCTGMALLAVGIACHLVSLHPLLEEQEDRPDYNKAITNCLKLPGVSLVVIVPVVGAIALPHIKPWSLRFGIPAICNPSFFERLV